MSRPVYEVLADAFIAEGMRVHFTLMGDGNMHWGGYLNDHPEVTSVYSRHEHCAVSMATAYSEATGDIGVASVTHGPGFTQVMTALVTAARSNVPVVVFVGETPTSALWYTQEIDQAPLARAAEAEYIRITNPKRMYARVREAFLIARTERRPVVVGIASDIQKAPCPELGAYQPSTEFLPTQAPISPAAADVEAVAEALLTARNPILLAGKGAMEAGAFAAIELLADATGAVLSTTLLTKGAFDHHPFSVGFSGGWASRVSRDVGRAADLVIAFGASLTTYTMAGGKMFPNARVIRVDTEPALVSYSYPSAQAAYRADARLFAEALSSVVAGRTSSAEVRTPELAERIATEPADPTEFEVREGLDPRQVMAKLDGLIGKDFDMVAGSGHQGFFHTHMRGRKAENYHFMRGFGAIGNGISHAMGVEVARGAGKTVLFDGDGSFLMHIQELEVVARHGMKILFVILNDGAYGSEIHKLRHEDKTTTGTIFGRGDLAAVARGFGIAGRQITELDQLPEALASFAAGDTAMVLDVHMSQDVVEPKMRALLQ